MSMTLRTPISSDYEDLASWIPDSVASARWAGPQLTFPFTASELPGLLAGETVSSFSLVDSVSEFLGFGQLVLKSRDVLHLSRIIVSPHRRGQGLGKTLCQLLLAVASARPEVTLLTLVVYRDNLAAITLYLGLGFIESPPHPRPELMAMQRNLACS